jgi:hypothetical protein
MAQGQPAEPFVPRKGDLMRELIQAFNALIAVWNARLVPPANGHADTCKMDRQEVPLNKVQPEGIQVNG